VTSPRLELVWPGKDKFLLVPKDDSGKPVWVERDHPAASEVRLTDITGSVGDVPDDPYAANLLFTGDSLDVLRVLAEVPEYRAQYRGKVKLVYIDPPFNTGQAFEHYDDWMEHSTWLSFMRERLLLIRDLLAPDGSVWVHLDDAEQHRMRLLMDEVFGATSHLGSVIWNHTAQSKNDQPYFSNHHNVILVYGTRGRTPRFSLPRKEVHNRAYRNPDNDARGPWRAGDVRSPSPRPTLTYSVQSPDGARIDAPPNGWRWSEDTFWSKVASGEISFVDGGTRVLRMNRHGFSAALIRAAARG